MIEKSTLFGTSKRVAGGGIAAGKGLGNGLMRAERTGKKSLVVADGSRTRKQAEHMLVCARRYEGIEGCLFASELCLEAFYFRRNRYVCYFHTAMVKNPSFLTM